jgi:DNA mismatch repair ATPase MutS
LAGLSDTMSQREIKQLQKKIPRFKCRMQMTNRLLYNTGMRKLWADHVLWTREYIVEAVNGSGSAEAAAARLMKNQEDIGNAVAKYYGSDAGKKLTTLLKEHISIAVEIVTAAKANDQAKLADANKRWETNAEQIATFLSSANPNWPKKDITDALKMHLSTTADELKAIQGKKYNESVTRFDAVFDHMMKVADTLSTGIIKQFPDKF